MKMASGLLVALSALVLATVSAAPTARVSSRWSMFKRIDREAYVRGWSDAPQIPFRNFSAQYVAHAMARPTDWRPQAVTPVKNQGPHGYCGTFGRVASAEGQFALRSGVPAPISFSEEELIDCIGWDQDQFSWFGPRGFMTSADYPYNISAYPDSDPPVPGNPCRFDASKVVPGTPNFWNATTGRAPDEAQLAAFVLHNGPVSAGINALVFDHMVPGCENDSSCFITAAECALVSQEIDHSTTIVGYGTDAAKGDYWIIKNSWGTKFANGGFINVQRGINCAGICGDPSICGNVFAHGSPDSYFE